MLTLIGVHLIGVAIGEGTLGATNLRTVENLAQKQLEETRGNFQIILSVRSNIFEVLESLNGSPSKSATHSTAIHTDISRIVVRSLGITVAKNELYDGHLDSMSVQRGNQ